MKFFIRILNVVLNQVPGRSRFDALRTAMSKVNIFLPVSKKRWEIAQCFFRRFIKNAFRILADFAANPCQSGIQKEVN